MLSSNSEGVIYDKTKKLSEIKECVSLCQFIEMLNQHSRSPMESPLKKLFDEAINPRIPNSGGKELKVIYPFGGADSATPFLLPNVREVDIIDYGYFYDDKTKLSESAFIDYEENLKDLRFGQGFSGANFDVTGKQSCFENDVVEDNINTVYNRSSKQTCYAVLIRLKTQLGAEINKVSFIDPKQKDLGFVIDFVDNQGNQRTLKYFQRSDCRKNEVSTQGRAEGASSSVRTNAIQQAIKNGDIVLFKAASGLSESSSATFLLDMLSDNAIVISDSPYKPHYAKWIEENLEIIKENIMESNLNLISYNENLGYSTFSKPFVAMISDVKAYKKLVGLIGELNESLGNSFEKEYALILKHILFGNEPSCLDLSINQWELIKIIRGLINELHVLDSESFDEGRLKETILRLIEKSSDFKIRLDDPDNSMGFYQLDLSRNSRFLNIFLDNTKYIKFPESESDKQKLIGGILDNFLTSNYSKSTDLYRDVLEKQINLFLNVMNVQKKDIEKIIREKNYKKFGAKTEAFLGALEKILNPELNKNNSQKAHETSGHNFLNVGSLNSHVEKNNNSRDPLKQEKQDFLEKIRTILLGQFEVEYLESEINDSVNDKKASEPLIEVLGMIYKAVPAEQKKEIQQEIQRIFNVDITKDNKKRL